LNIARGLVVHPEMISRNVMTHLPFMATEEIMMRASQAGADRQVVHEAIRQHSHAAMVHVKAGKGNDLVDRLSSDPLFSGIDIRSLTIPEHFIGRSKEQVEEFLCEVVQPMMARHVSAKRLNAEINV